MLPTLTTTRFILQQVVPEDLPFIFEGLSHPAIIPFYGVRFETVDATKKQMDWYEKSISEGSGGPWKIIDKISEKKIGVVAYYFFKPEHKKAEVGFWIFPEYWNTGVATEALGAVIKYCQHEKNIHRLEAFVEEGNMGSCRVLEKLGFLYEGTMRECEIKEGKYINLLVYALVRSA